MSLVPIVIGVWDKAEGRDKTTKLVQYLARFHESRSGSTQAKNLETALGMARKAFRFGKSIHSWPRLLQAVKSANALAVIQHSGIFVYFVLDNVVWLARAKIALVNADIDRWNYWSFAAWMAGTTASAASDIKDLAVLALQKRDAAVNRQIRALVLRLVKAYGDLVTAAAVVFPGAKITRTQTGAWGAVSALISIYQLM